MQSNTSLNKVILRKLQPTDKEQILNASLIQWENDFDFLGGAFKRSQNSFENYLILLNEEENRIGLPEGYVACTFLFAFSATNQLIGRVSFRHTLNDFLFKFAGHVGYGVIPQFRNQGHATKILSLAIDYIKKYHTNIDQILLTCDPTNIGSIKVIEKNNGIIDQSIVELNKIKNRYWIKLK